MSDLYDDDILLWSERQGELLRRRAAGELVNDAELDWPNIAEEIESVGSEQLHAVESLLVQALAHMLKADAWPLSREVPGWTKASSKVAIADMPLEKLKASSASSQRPSRSSRIS